VSADRGGRGTRRCRCRCRCSLSLPLSASGTLIDAKGRCWTTGSARLAAFLIPCHPERACESRGPPHEANGHCSLVAARQRIPGTGSATDRAVPEHRDPKRHQAASAAASATAISLGIRHGHGFRTRPPVTVAVTDQRPRGAPRTRDHTSPETRRTGPARGRLVDFQNDDRYTDGRKVSRMSWVVGSLSRPAVAFSRISVRRSVRDGFCTL
jgi:hypothetical protein